MNKRFKYEKEWSYLGLIGVLFFFCRAFFSLQSRIFISFAFTFNLKTSDDPILKALKALAIKIMNRLVDIEGEIDASGCVFEGRCATSSLGSFMKEKN